MKKRTAAWLMMLTLCITAGCGTAGGNINSGEAGITEVPTVTEEPEEEIAAVYTEPNYEGIAVKSNNARISVHDPSIDVFNGKYYIYGSHMTAAVSEDMSTWKWLGKVYGSKNDVYGKIYDCAEAYRYSGLGTSVIPTDDKGIHVWAPDVIYNKAMGKYVMYFCMSSTWNASNLCWATADAPEGPFEWQGELIYSGFSKNNINETDVLQVVDEDWAVEHYYSSDGYNYRQYPNAIDPTIFYDADGRMWMVYGSWSGGIFLLEIDEKTGLVIHPKADEENLVDPYFGKKLVGGFHKSIEGPYIHYDEKSGYYYLFLSYGGLAQTGGYQIRVFRSDKVDGTYVDLNGNTSINQGGHAAFGVKLSGNYNLPSLKYAYMATGGQSCFTDTDGKQYICYHSRFKTQGEYHEPVVKQFFINEEGWPCLLPYKTAGETISETGYDKADIVGDYFFVNNGEKIDAVICEPVMITLHDDGKITGTYLGTWEAKDGTYFMHLTVDGKEYSGVFCKQYDMTGQEVMTFSAVGGITSVWGVKYLNTAN